MKFSSLFNLCLALSSSIVFAAPLPSPLPPHHHQHIHNAALSQAVNPNRLSIHELPLPNNGHRREISISSDPTNVLPNVLTRRGNSLASSTPADPQPPSRGTTQSWDIRLLEYTNPTFETRMKYRYYRYAAREYVHGRRPWGDWYLRRQARKMGRDMLRRGNWQERGLVRGSPFEKRSVGNETDSSLDSTLGKEVKEEGEDLKKRVRLRLFGFNIF